MTVKLTTGNIKAIESALKGGGAPEAVVKVEKGQVVVLKVEKKKIITA